MREPRDWDEEYLLNLPIGEFDWLEVKGRRALDLTLANANEHDIRETLSKAVSAFANSGGGVLVLGLSNPQQSWHVDDGGIDLVAKKPSTREWLEDIIPTLVDLPLTSFNVYVFQNAGSNSQVAAGRGVFVVEIRDSDSAPHQAIDNRYYARVGGKSRPIGHRLVTDIFGRRQHPKIQLEFMIETSTHVSGTSFPTFSISPLGMSSSDGTEKERKVELVIKARNLGRVFANYMNAFVLIPAILLPEFELEYIIHGNDLEEIDGVKYLSKAKRNTRRDVVKAAAMGADQYGSSWFDPILPSLAYTWDWELTDRFTTEKFGNLQIIWKVYADNAPVQNGSIFVRDIPVVTKD